MNDIGGSLTGDRSAATDAAGAVVKEIIANGGNAVANYTSVLEGREVVDFAVKTFGSCDIVVNNAGTLRDKSFHKMSKEEWMSVVNTHLHG